MIETFYDLYRGLAEETIDILLDPDKQRALARAQGMDALREALAVDPHFLYKTRKVTPGMKHMLNQIARCAPYILKKEVLSLAFDLVRTSGKRPLDAAPFLSVPLWVEFSETGIGQKDEQYVALFVYHGYDPGEIRCDILSENMQRAKTLIFTQDGHWEYEQNGACNSTECLIAPYTKEGVPFRIRESDSFSMCRCHEGGESLAQIIKAINHLLIYRKSPLVRSVVERTQPLPHREGKLTRKQKEENSAVSKRNKPNIVTISLSSPVQVEQRPPSGKGEFVTAEHVEQKVNVESHWRWLIPGEGKPWKALQVLLIENYDRAQKPASQRTRHIVEE